MAKTATTGVVEILAVFRPDAQLCRQLGVATDPLRAGKDLGRGRYPMSRLEGVHRLAAGEAVVGDQQKQPAWFFASRSGDCPCLGASPIG